MPLRPQQLERRRRKRPVGVEALGAGDERFPGIVIAHFRGQALPLRFRHVGRIGDHRVHAAQPIRGRPPQVAAPKLDPRRHAVGFGVVPRHAQRFVRAVQRVQAQVGPAPRQRDGDAAAARPQVGHPGGGRKLELERGVDQPLGLGPRNQHRGSYPKSEPEELLDAGDVLGRLARGATVDPLGVAGLARGRERLAASHEQTAAVELQQVGQQQEGLVSRVGHTAAAQPFLRRVQCLPDRQASTSCFRRSA